MPEPDNGDRRPLTAVSLLTCPCGNDHDRWILDLFCGAGGAGMGYHRAGFGVIGIDIRPQPHYPFRFIQADAMTYPLDGFDAGHASPVCKRWSTATPGWAKENHPNQIAAVRDRFTRTGIPWVIENVPGAPLRPDIVLCGCVVGLTELERKRWFELGNWSMFDLRPPCYHATSPITVAGHGEPSGPRMARGEIARKADWERAMGIDWMNRDELAQAIPPAFTEYLGGFLMDHLRAVEREAG